MLNIHSAKVAIGLAVSMSFLLAAGWLAARFGQFLTMENTRYEAYFAGSVKGLRRGAGVLFRGVRIGYVESLELQLAYPSTETSVKVVMRADPRRYLLTRNGVPLAPEEQIRELADASPEELIEAGLRAQLVVENYVTGQLLIEVDFHPETKAVYRASASEFAEIPTIAPDLGLFQMVEYVLGELSTMEASEVKRDIAEFLLTVRALTELPHFHRGFRMVDVFANSRETQDLPKNLLRMVEELHAAVLAFESAIDQGRVRKDELVQWWEEFGSGLSMAADLIETAHTSGDRILSEESTLPIVKQLQTLERMAQELRQRVESLDPIVGSKE